MSREIEARVKAAVEAKMQTVTPDRVRPPQPPTDHDLAQSPNRRHRRTRWVPPLLAAAAVVAVALGTTAVVTLADRQHPPVGTPTPSPTAPSTAAPTTAPSTAPSSPTRESSTPPAPSTPSTASGAPSTAASHAIDVTFGEATVGVTVLSGWVVSHTNPPRCCNTPPTRCIVHGGADYAGDANACLLTITLGHLSPDTPYPSRGQSKCQRWHTIAESNGYIQGRVGEYRKFEDSCSGAIYEQWTIMSSPMIAFWHPVSTQSPADLAKHIIDTAALPTEVDALRQMDEGYVRALTKHADGYHVTIDRVVVNLDGSVTNVNHATYEYLLSGALTMTGDSPCWHCTEIDQVYQQYLKGPHPSDGSKPIAGAYIRVSPGQASNVDPGYALELNPIVPFQS